MSTQESAQAKTEEIRDRILAVLDSKVTSAEKIASIARDEVKVNTDSRYEAQARTFMEAVARQAVGDEVWEVYKRVRDAVDPLQELAEMTDEFTKMVFEYGSRMPSDTAGRAFVELKHKYLIEATKDMRSVLKVLSRK